MVNRLSANVNTILDEQSLFQGSICTQPFHFDILVGGSITTLQCFVMDPTD